MQCMARKFCFPFLPFMRLNSPTLEICVQRMARVAVGAPLHWTRGQVAAGHLGVSKWNRSESCGRSLPIAVLRPMALVAVRAPLQPSG